MVRLGFARVVRLGFARVLRLGLGGSVWARTLALLGLLLLQPGVHRLDPACRSPPRLRDRAVEARSAWCLFLVLVLISGAVEYTVPATGYRLHTDYTYTAVYT